VLGVALMTTLDLIALCVGRVLLGLGGLTLFVFVLNWLLVWCLSRGKNAAWCIAFVCRWKWREKSQWLCPECRKNLVLYRGGDENKGEKA
jgi:hypothetical protein